MAKVKEPEIVYSPHIKSKSSSKSRTAKNKIEKSSDDVLSKEEKRKLIFELAGNVDWQGNLSQMRKARTFDDSL
ncbi:MAG: hypothetical protein KGZ58_09980 [Ignavibacteriales bacterium]|nr:hypothetical protein [Ignavibacteriales bacterium]